MFNPKSYENSRPGGLSVLEVVGGETPVDDLTIPTPRFVPLKSTELRGEIMGPLASLHLTQVYGYAREQCDRVLEAVYRFPLPGDAAVTGLRVRFGEVEIQADLQERQQAETAYQEARQRGQHAALLTRESPDVFSLSVAGLHPDEDIIVETSYVQLARMEGPGWSLRLPLTTAPRYVRSDELDARNAQGQPLLLLRDPGHRFGLDLSLSGAGSAVSMTHPLTTERDGDVLHVGLRDGPVIPDRDFVLSWEPQQEPGWPTLRAWTYDDRAAGQVYFLASVAPPASRDPEQTLPREVILLVDHSGSMEGAKWEAADWAVTRFLSELTERDIVNLGLFHNTTRWFSTAPRHAFADTIARAREFVEAHRDSGGTDLGVALEQALAMERHGGTYARHIVVITDAQVTDAGRILRLADHEWQQDERRRISVLCIDAAPNSFLANELAERGGGVARFLTSAPEEDDITTALDEVLADWAQPVQTGLRLEVNRGEIETSGRRLCDTGGRQNAIDVGDLPGGRSVWVCGRAPAGGTSEVAFRLIAPGDREVATYRAELGEQTEAMPALKALFGARRVLGLEFLMHAGYNEAELAEQLARLGYNPQQVLAAQKLYAENVRAENERLLRPLLVQEALAYGLASAETAFVAVRREQGRSVEGTVLVGNALPAGWSDDAAVAPHAYYSLSLDALHHAATPQYSSSPPASRARKLFRIERVTTPHSGATTPRSAEIFSGIPRPDGHEAVLFDSMHAAAATSLPEECMFSRLRVLFPAGTPKADDVDPAISLLLFVDDLSAPRASVRLVDLVRQGGERPLHIAKRPGQVVRLVLADPAGAWPPSAYPITVILEWQ